MADMILTCPKCETKVTVSEFIKEESVPCRTCGEAVPLPSRTKSAVLSLKKHVEPPAPPPSLAPAPTPPGRQAPAAVVKESKFLKHEQQRVKANTVVQACSWIVFILLAAGLAWLRFYADLPGLPLKTIKAYGLYAIFASYLLIIVLAVKDHMVYGLLSLVVPLYPFYYLFLVSANVYVRAIVGALLIAFGWDFLLFLQGQWDAMYARITHLIQHAND